MPGTLFVVATPIGNLEDLTFRALRTLKEVDLIAAEDTRRTSKLLSHYGVSKPLVSLREHNEAREAAKLVSRLKAGQHIALVSDAGTPAIADPGARLVRAARLEGLRVVPIPGASAITAAISASGLDSTEFSFVGFPPSARLARKRWLEGLRDEPRAIVLFEAPHRIKETLDDIASILVKRQINIFREITKINEEYVERPTTSVIEATPLVERGEFTLVLDPATKSSADQYVDQVKSVLLFDQIIRSGLIDEIAATRAVASALDINADIAAKAIKKGRILVNRQNRPAP